MERKKTVPAHVMEQPPREVRQRQYRSGPETVAVHVEESGKILVDGKDSGKLLVDEKDYFQLLKSATLLQRIVILLDEAFQAKDSNGWPALGRIRAEIQRSGVKP